MSDVTGLVDFFLFRYLVKQEVEDGWLMYIPALTASGGEIIGNIRIESPRNLIRVDPTDYVMQSSFCMYTQPNGDIPR